MKPFLNGTMLVAIFAFSLTLISTSLYPILKPYQSASPALPPETPARIHKPAPESGASLPTVEPLDIRTDRPLPEDKVLPRLEDFIRQVYNGVANEPRGLYVVGKMALRIVQQPDGDPKYVSQENDTATQFYRAGLFGTIGLLAHNFLAGQNFLPLQTGQDLILIYGDKKIEHFQISEISDYQRMTLADIHSDFTEVASQKKASADQVFTRFYERGHVLTLQTCLARDGASDWGVRFILANPAPNFP